MKINKPNQKHYPTKTLITVDLIEYYLLDNYPHLYKLTTRKEIKEWVETYRKIKENELQ